MKNNILVVLLLPIVLFACNSTSNIKTEAALKNYIADEANGLTKTSKVNDIVFTVSYHPTELILVNELVHAEDSVEKIKIIDNYSQYEYFKLSISKEGKNLLSTLPKEYYSQYVNVFSFRMQDYFYLKPGSNSEKIAPLNYQFEQLYGLSSEDNFLFVFNKSDLELNSPEEIKIIIEDFGLTVGKQIFTFSNSSLQQAKEINLTHTSHI